MDINDEMTPEYCREYGKRLLKSDVKEDRVNGMGYLLRARKAGDPEACYLVGKMLLDGTLKVRNKDPREEGISDLWYAATKGYPEARALLNRQMTAGNKAVHKAKADHPLTGFDGKRIRINKKGLLTPIDAVLEYADGMNVLRLSANILFYDDDVPDRGRFEVAVLKGIKLWEGQYAVFGDQPVKVEVNLTTEERLIDTVFVTASVSKSMEKYREITERFGTERMKHNMKAVADDKRSSMVYVGGKWSPGSLKLINIESDDGKFTDYEEIMHIAKHEFGHALGLGDLYAESDDGLEGVPRGRFEELDQYLVSDRLYYLVMCDHHAPVTNNDIEMVLLAYSRNKAQLFQKSAIKGEISEALGKGN